MTLQDAANCAWADYRKDYGVSSLQPYRVQEHKAFHAGWAAAKGDLQRGYYLVPLEDLPDVDDDNEVPVKAGRCYASTAEGAWENVRAFAALARHHEARESEAAALERRRDELAREFTGARRESYLNACGELARAIDYIIDTEDARTVARLKATS